MGDFVIITRSSSLPAAERRIQLAINIATKWTEKYGVAFSLDKTMYSLYEAKRSVFFSHTEHGTKPSQSRQRGKLSGSFFLFEAVVDTSLEATA